MYSLTLRIFMTALSIEERLEKLEAQMQKRIERQNLFSELLYQQAQMQPSILYLAVPNASENSAIVQALSPLLELWNQQYQQILAELHQDDEVGREYVRSLQNLFEQK